MTIEYRAWDSMRQRCNNPNHRQYANYGGRGIIVCKRWNEFVNFLADMGRRPAGKSLDRIDNSKGYYPSNCRWATSVEQNRNTRGNAKLAIDGKTLARIAWSEVSGIPSRTIKRRLDKGMTPRQAVFTPRMTRINHS